MKTDPFQVRTQSICHLWDSVLNTRCHRQGAIPFKLQCLIQSWESVLRMGLRVPILQLEKLRLRTLRKFAREAHLVEPASRGGKAFTVACPILVSLILLYDACLVNSYWFTESIRVQLALTMFCNSPSPNSLGFCPSIFHSFCLVFLSVMVHLILCWKALPIVLSKLNLTNT